MSESLEDFAIGVARRAGELLLDYSRRGLTQVSLKPDYSLVTEADVAADEAIRKEILAAYPGDFVISEEVEPLYAREAPSVWIVDPLDGTTNFSLGLPYWGVSIACVEDRGPVTAALYFPVLDEVYSASLGGGARLNGRPCATVLPDAEHPIGLLTCCSRAHRMYDINLPLKTRVLGSATYSLCSVAKGSAVLSFEATAKLWDLAAASLVVTEAGGFVESVAGGQPFPLQVSEDYSKRSFTTMAAASQEFAGRAREGISAK